MSKVRTLFVIDAIIAAALVAAGTSAIAFLVPFSAIDFATSSAAPTFLGLSYDVWHTMHMYSGLLMVAGGFVHLVMHWSWLVTSAKSTFGGGKKHRKLDKTDSGSANNAA